MAKLFVPSVNWSTGVVMREKTFIGKKKKGFFRGYSVNSCGETLNVSRWDRRSSIRILPSFLIAPSFPHLPPLLEPLYFPLPRILVAEEGWG